MRKLNVPTFNLLLALTIIYVFFSACEKIECPRIDVVNIEERIIPDTVLANDQIQLFIRSAARIGCYTDLFVEMNQKNEFEYNIRANATWTCCAEKCACPSASFRQDTLIHFQPNKPGTILFNITLSRFATEVDTMIVIK